MVLFGLVSVIMEHVMNMMNKQKGIGLTEILVFILIWWVVFYVFFDWQLSLRVERASPSADIFESIKDSAIKSFTVTDHGFVDDEHIINDD